MALLVSAVTSERVRSLVRRAVYRAVGRTTPRLGGRARTIVTATAVEATPTGGVVEVAPGAIITPLARQAAMERGVRLVASGAAVALTPAAEVSRGTRIVAIGADHGGYELKQLLKGHVEQLGYQVTDCGTTGTAAVDYPDFAFTVARHVAGGSAWRGILVDGAGIGSCMAANKVPGIRAAMCYDEATVVNSRSHNDANVLTLGATIDHDLARRLVGIWLETPAEGGRHARRVRKIMDIERRFLRTA